MDISPFEGLHIVAKFFLSKHPDGSYRYISRTLGKFSIVDRESQDKVGHKEVWVCRITREIRPGKSFSAFVLMPLEKLHSPNTQLKKLIPGYYDVFPQNGAALVVPNQDRSHFWVLSHITRSLFEDYYAVVVPIDYSPKKAEESEHAISSPEDQGSLESGPSIRPDEEGDLSGLEDGPGL